MFFIIQKPLTENIFRKAFHTPTIQSLPKNIFRNTLTPFIFINKLLLISIRNGESGLSSSINIKSVCLCIWYSLVFESFIFFIFLKFDVFYIFVDFRGKNFVLDTAWRTRSFDYLDKITEFFELNSAWCEQSFGYLIEFYFERNSRTF